MGSNRSSRKRKRSRSRRRPARESRDRSTASLTSSSATSRSSSKYRRQSRRSRRYLKRRRSSYRSRSSMHRSSRKINNRDESPSRSRRRHDRSDSTVNNRGRSLRRRTARTMTPPLPRVPRPIQQAPEPTPGLSEHKAELSVAGTQWVPGTNTAFNSLPDFDPSDGTQSIDTWIHKVTECSMIYGWTDKQICFFALSKLSGLAKRWYQGLPSLMFTWEQWVEKLKLAFPSNENYGDLLTKMLKIRCRFGQSLDVYFYDKMAMLNKCGIVGINAVGCLIHGIEDKFIRMGATAGRYEQPEQLFSYLRQITINQSVEQSQLPLRSRSLAIKSNRAEHVATSESNRAIRCFNCGEFGHISLKCPKPVKKCDYCSMLGHLAKDCRRRPGTILPVAPNIQNAGTTGATNIMNIRSNIAKSDKYYKLVKVNGHELKSFVDFGSCSTLIRESEAKNILRSWSNSGITPLKGFGNAPVMPLGSSRVLVELDSVSAEVDVLIVADHLMHTAIIIGQTFTEQPNIVVYKSKDDLVFFEGPNLDIGDFDKQKLKIKSDTKIDAWTTSPIEIQSDSAVSGSFYIAGGYHSTDGQVYVVIPGLYEFNDGLGVLMVSNASDSELVLAKGKVIARGLPFKEVANNSIQMIDATPRALPLDLIKVGVTMNETETARFHSLLNAYRDCFALNLSELGKTTLTEMEINLSDNTPVVYNPYRMSRVERDKLSLIIEDLLKNGIIRESSSSYASPVILVNKKNGDKRLCVDYRQLNRKTLKDKYPLPRIEDQLDDLGDNKLFTSLDLASGYYQVPVAEESKHLTAFVTPDGLYEYNRMPFGLTNAPSVFQRTMNTLLRGHKGLALSFMDDLLIPSSNIDDGMNKLEQILQLLRGAKLTLNLNKCKFFATEIDYLGYEISSEGIRPGSHKIEAVEKFPVPKNVHEVRQFVGLASYFRRFIKDFSLIAKPLTILTKKDEPWRFEEAQLNAFNVLKQRLISRPVLALYNPAAKLELHTDASKLGLGAILFQHDEQLRLKAIAYFSRQTSPEEQKFHSYELETLALVVALQKFRVYLLGNSFTVVTDCSAVRSTMMKRDLLPRVARWWIIMQEYDFNIEFRPGDRMAHVDALSRCPVSTETPVDMNIIDILRIDSLDQASWLETVQQADAEVMRMMEIIKDPEMQAVVEVRNNFTVKNNRLYRVVKRDDETVLLWVVPKSVRWQIAKMNHDDVGHFGFDKTYDRVRKVYWFKGMRRFIAKYCQSCLNCAHNKLPGGPKEGMLHPIPKVSKPFDTLHADHCGPFPTSKRKNCYLFAMIDSFTKFIYVKAVRNTKSRTSINVFEEYFAIFGVPKRLITDRGSSFTSREFEKFTTDKGIKHILNSVATPRANGQIERYNRTLVDAITAANHGLPESDWDTVIPKVQWGLNNTVNKNTGKSPAEVLFGIAPTGVCDGIMNPIVAEASETLDRDSIRDDVQNRIRNEQEKQKIRFDKVRKEARIYSVGDLVRVEREIRSGNLPGQSKKLNPKCYGPYRVVRVLGSDRYEVEDTPITRKEGKPIYKGVYAVDKIFPWMNFSTDLVEDDSD